MVNAFTEFTVHYMSLFWWFWSKWLYEWLMCVFALSLVLFLGGGWLRGNGGGLVLDWCNTWYFVGGLWCRWRPMNG